MVCIRGGNGTIGDERHFKPMSGGLQFVANQIFQGQTQPPGKIGVIGQITLLIQQNQERFLDQIFGKMTVVQHINRLLI